MTTVSIANQPPPASNGRVRWRLLGRLAYRGPFGMTRATLREDAGARTRANTFAELDLLINEGLVEFVPGEKRGGIYRLTPAAVRKVGELDPAIVGDFYRPFDQPIRISGYPTVASFWE